VYDPGETAWFYEAGNPDCKFAAHTRLAKRLVTYTKEIKKDAESQEEKNFFWI